MRLRRLMGLWAAVAWLAMAAGSSSQGAEPTRKSIVAYSGKPFGVGRVEIEYSAGGELSLPSDAPCWLSDKAERLLYPVCETGRIQTGVDNAGNEVKRITGWFLFRGDQPLNVSLDADSAYFRWDGKPVAEAEEHAKLLKEWWSQYSGRALLLSKSEVHPLLVESYVVPMLARRLKLVSPDFSVSLTGRRDFDQLLGTLVGTESIRLAMQKEATLGRSAATQKASEPLPEAVVPPPVVIPPVPGDVEIEPIAQHVPQECFYVRCRNFANYRWMRENTDQWGGSARDLSSLRGIDYGIRERIEGQMSLKEGLLARLFGSFVMSDMAIIGSDTFFREGPAVGIIFEANRSQALGKQIQVQRRQTLEAHSDVTEKNVKLAGHNVSLIESPDHSIRSFYAVDGQFHLVTNSETIAKRFFEAGAGKESLGASAEFRHARHLFPVSREDDIFVYFSDPFFGQLISPRYRIEMTRRMQAEVDLEVLALARLAAIAEQQPAKSVDDLIEGGFLPPDFGKRADGSRPELTPAGNVRDSLRGSRRTFLPIPDVAITNCTPAEAKAYGEFGNMYRGLWQRMDPVAIAIRRVTDAEHPERERVTFDLHISPLARDQYGFLAAILGTPDQTQFVPVAGNLLSAQLLFKNPFGRQDTIYRAAATVRDGTISYVINRGQVLQPRSNEVPDDFPPFFLAVARDAKANEEPPHSMDRERLLKQPRNQTVKLDGNGWGGAWHRWNDDFEMIAWSEKVPEKALPQLKLEKASRPAQLRLRIANPVGNQVTPYLQAQAFCRARQTSQSNVNLFHSLVQQLHVPSEKALTTYQDILAGEPVCPLGGKYIRNENGPGPVRWLSSEWKTELLSQVNSIPSNYHSPLLDWFRGMEVEFTVDPRASVLSTHVEVELAPTAIGQ